MSAVYLAAAIALPDNGDPDLDAMRAFVAAHPGPWPMSTDTYPAGLFEAERDSDPVPVAGEAATWRTVWARILDDFAGLLESHDDVAYLRLRGCWYLVVGGDSWGDTPDDYNTVSSIAEWADLCAAGGLPYTWEEGATGKVTDQ
ncbi:MAG: hypothetical protein L0H78_24265 [Humibacillus sp.]|nr:hypothetical protein [Humibacillus sp.]